MVLKMKREKKSQILEFVYVINSPLFRPRPTWKDIGSCLAC